MIKKWIARPILDWVAGGVAVAATWLVGGQDWLSFTNELDLSTRQSLYQTLTGVSGGLLGFFIATVAILLGIDASRPRMKIALSGENRSNVESFFFAGIRSISVALVAFILMLVLDKGIAPAKWVEPTLVLTVVLAVARASRVVWILNQVVKIAGRDDEEA